MKKNFVGFAYIFSRIRLMTYAEGVSTHKSLQDLMWNAVLAGLTGVEGHSIKAAAAFWEMMSAG